MAWPRKRCNTGLVAGLMVSGSSLHCNFRARSQGTSRGMPCVGIMTARRDALAAQQGFAAQPGRVLGGDGGLVPDAVDQLRLQGCSPQLRQQVGHASEGAQSGTVLTGVCWCSPFN